MQFCRLRQRVSSGISLPLPDIAGPERSSMRRNVSVNCSPLLASGEQHTTAEKRGRHTNDGWREEPLALAFLKVICPSTQKNYFLRVDPEVENVKQALESTLVGYTRDWEQDLVTET